MKSEPLLKGQPPTSPEVFAWRTTFVTVNRHSSTAASVVIEDRSAGSAASCRIFCSPSTMSCRAAISAMTPARSPFTMEARSVLARSTLPLIRHHSIFRILEEPAASRTVRAAADTLLSGRERFYEQSSYALLHKQIELLRSSDPSDPFGQGLQFSGSVFHVVGLDV